jgi:hypothetical protein
VLAILEETDVKPDAMTVGDMAPTTRWPVRPWLNGWSTPLPDLVNFARRPAVERGMRSMFVEPARVESKLSPHRCEQNGTITMRMHSSFIERMNRSTMVMLADGRSVQSPWRAPTKMGEPRS